MNEDLERKVEDPIKEILSIRKDFLHVGIQYINVLGASSERERQAIIRVRIAHKLFNYAFLIGHLFGGINRRDSYAGVLVAYVVRPIEELYNRRGDINNADLKELLDDTMIRYQNLFDYLSGNVTIGKK